jgi:integrase
VSRIPKIPKKPNSISNEGVSAYVIRGPHADGRWYWQATARISGTRKTVWRGWATRAEAVVEVSRMRADLGEDLDAPAVASNLNQAGGLTVAELLDQWLHDCSERPHMSPETLTSYQQAADCLTARLGAYRVSEISIKHTQKFLNLRVSVDGVMRRTAWADVCRLRTAWRWGHKARLHDEPLHLPERTSWPLEKIDVPRPDRTEAWKIWDALRESGCPRWVVVTYLVGIVTGARPGEIWALQVNDVDLRARTISVPEVDGRTGRRTKTGARLIVLDKDSAAALSPFVHRRDGAERLIGDIARGTVNHAGRYIRAACAKVNAPVHQLKALRHSATDAYYDAGVPPEVEAAQLGHCEEVARRNYRRVRKEKQRLGADTVALGRRPTPPESPEPDGVDAANQEPARKQDDVLARVERKISWGGVR